MLLPGAVVPEGRVPCSSWRGPCRGRAPSARLARGAGILAPATHPALGRMAASGFRRRRMPSGGRMSPRRWGGGEAASRPAGQPPAPLVHGPMVGPAQQGQVGQVGGAAVEPVAQMVGLTPAQGSGTVGEHTAPVADGQGDGLGGWTTRLVRPTASGWVGAHPGPEATGRWRLAAALPAPAAGCGGGRSVAGGWLGPGPPTAARGPGGGLPVAGRGPGGPLVGGRRLGGGPLVAVGRLSDGWGGSGRRGGG
jgi:hypothetical protein